MAIFRGTGGAGDSTDDSIVSEVTEQAGIATTKAQEAATSATNASNSASSASSSETAASNSATAAAGSASTATTKASEAASHASDALASKNAAATSATAAADSATAANSANVQTVAGLSTEITNLNGIRTDITGVNAVRADVVTVSGISSDVTTVAADASDIGTVATNITNVNNVGDNISNVNAVHSNASNINTVAADGSDIGTVAGNISNVNTVAGISSDVTTVAGLESKMDAVIADASDIGAVAGNIGNVNTVAGDSSDINTVAGISADVTSVADNMTDVQNADTNAANAATSASNASDSASAASTSASSASSSASSASTSATNAGNSATAASNSATAASASKDAAAVSASAASGSASAAASSASAASTSASNAATSETNSEGSENASALSATAAATSASNAATSESNAATSATNAAVSETNAAASYDSFDDRYLGVKSSAPSTDNDGGALLTGALYFNSTSNTMFVFTGSAWAAVANNNIINPNVALTQDLATNGNDVKFGDNDKATFGAGDDLQIYHDGSHSYISDTGTGNLRIRGTDITLQDASGNGYISMVDGGAGGTVYLKHLGNNVLATTSTGIDVTGTATMDGLVVEGNTYIDTNNGADAFYVTRYGNVQNESASFVVDDGALTINSIQDEQYGSFRINSTRDGVGTATRFNIDNDGDISFYEDTGTTPKLFWDASAESLGIGTSSPSQILHIRSTTSNPTGIGLQNSQRYYAIRSNNYSLVFSDETVSQERMRISSDGNVGIGTSSPSTTLELAKNSNGHGLTLSQDNTGSSYHSKITFRQNNGSGGYAETAAIKAYGSTNGANGDLRFYTNSSGAERMRIDSSGNLLVGKTSTSGNTVGAELRSNGGIFGTKDGAYVARFNRKTSDGSIVELQKDGTTVGSIGALSSRMYMGTGDTGLFFNDQTDQIQPWNTATNAARDAAIDLGRTDRRFKDLYLSGTANAPVVSVSPYTGLFNAGTNKIGFQINGQQKAQIDASGNLLVGQTSQSPNTVGVSLNSNGNISAKRDGGIVGLFNRGTSDGTIVDFRKNGTTVGSIGVLNGDNLRISGSVSNHTGIQFGTAVIAPMKSGAENDGDVDLGFSNARFKDLYLSGGVYLGGTGAANKLDDYEEGESTALTMTTETSGSITLNTSYDTFKYTKIGDRVTVSGQFVVSSVSSPVGNKVFLPLPFTSASGASKRSGTAAYYYTGSGVESLIPCGTQDGAAFLTIHLDASTIAATHEFWFDVTYQAG